MRTIDRMAKHPTGKPTASHSCILLPGGDTGDMSSVGLPGKSPTKNATTYYLSQHPCGLFPSLLFFFPVN